MSEGLEGKIRRHLFADARLPNCDFDLIAETAASVAEHYYEQADVERFAELREQFAHYDRVIDSFAAVSSQAGRIAAVRVLEAARRLLTPPETT